jgi:SAM-dependent methyltransferase
MDPKQHWETVHQAKAPTEVSWYQEHAARSMDFIRRTGVARAGRIIDVGGGVSTLVDDLLAEGYSDVTVLDISPAALDVARSRLGDAAARVTWIEADVLCADLPAGSYDLWHDRAVFHFLTEEADRARYVECVRRAVKPGGHVIVATFAGDGPTQCSGLDVVRYDPESLHGAFGDEFRLVDSAGETHVTPAGSEQSFVYCYCRVG